MDGFSLSEVPGSCADPEKEASRAHRGKWGPHRFMNIYLELIIEL